MKIRGKEHSLKSEYRVFYLCDLESYFFFFFFATLLGLWDLYSQTKD